MPEVKKLPPQYIYEPWTAPISMQKQAGCVIGTDYPHRVVIHEDVHKENIKRMSDAYKKTKASKTTEGTGNFIYIDKIKLLLICDCLFVCNPQDRSADCYDIFVRYST